MGSAWRIEAEDEVDTWLMKLSTRDAARTRFYLQLPSQHGSTLAMPYARSLGNGLRELRFHLRDEQRRITFWIAPDRRIVLLTTFPQTAPERTPRSRARPQYSQTSATGVRPMNSRRDIEEIYTARDDTDADEFREAYEETRRSYEFGVLTRTLRKAAGLTQKELATRMGTTASAIARLEAGGTSPTFGTLERLAEALGVQLRLEVADATDLPAVTFGAA